MGALAEARRGRQREDYKAQLRQARRAIEEKDAELLDMQIEISALKDLLDASLTLSSKLIQKVL